MEDWVSFIKVRDICTAYEGFCKELSKECEMSKWLNIDDSMIGFHVRVLMDMWMALECSAQSTVVIMDNMTDMRALVLQISSFPVLVAWL